MSDNISFYPGGPARPVDTEAATRNRDHLVENPESVQTFYNDRVVDRDPYASPTTASDTLTGATSADVHAGLGHPGQGQTSAELRHDGEHHRKKQGQGLDQWGTKQSKNMKVGEDERARDIDMEGFSREQPNV